MDSEKQKSDVADNEALAANTGDTDTESEHEEGDIQVPGISRTPTSLGPVTRSQTASGRSPPVGRTLYRTPPRTQKSPPATDPAAPSGPTAPGPSTTGGPPGRPQTTNTPPAMAAQGAQGSQTSQISKFSNLPADGTIEMWCYMVEASQKAYNWTEEVTAASVRPKLGGTALTTVMAQEKLNNWLTTWTELKTVLIEAFGTPENNITAARAMENLKQMPNESVQELHDRIVMALDKKNFAVSKDDKKKADYLERLRSEIFIFLTANMKQDIREAAFAGVTPPADAVQLLKAAKRIEKDMKIQREKKSSEVGEVAKEEKKEKEKKEEQRVEAISGKPRDNRCYNCWTLGHRAAVCRNARRPKPGNAGGYQPRPAANYQPRPNHYQPRPTGYQPRFAGPRPGGFGPPRGPPQSYRPRPPPRQYVHEVDQSAQPYYQHEPQDYQHHPDSHYQAPAYQLDYYPPGEYYQPEEQPAENYRGNE